MSDHGLTWILNIYWEGGAPRRLDRKSTPKFRSPRVLGGAKTGSAVTDRFALAPSFLLMNNVCKCSHKGWGAHGRPKH